MMRWDVIRPNAIDMNAISHFNKWNYQLINKAVWLNKSSWVITSDTAFKSLINEFMIMKSDKDDEIE